MKRFWLVLLLLGLIMTFSASAFAVEVKVGAEYYAAGLYLNKITVDDGFERWQGNRGSVQPSTAFFFQRLRVGTDFVVSPSLKLVTRFDAMERIWGGTRSNPFYSDPGQRLTDDAFSAGSRAENENIAFDLAYIDYTSPIGLFQIGYQPDSVWGTLFADRATGTPAGQINFTKSVGPVTIALQYAKEADTSYSYTNPIATHTDGDYDCYGIGGIYTFKAGEAGAALYLNRDTRHKGGFTPYAANYTSDVFVLEPYVKAKVGPVALQAEVNYYFGDAMKWEDGYLGDPNVNVSALSVFLDATASFGIFSVGGSFAYLSGDDPDTADKIEGGINTAGLDWNPCLILFNNDIVNHWVGGIAGHSGTSVGGEMANAWFFQGRVGVTPTPQLDIALALAYATADKKPAGIPGGSYGTEVDVTGTYKITNNLSYMIGVGYLFTGDYFKGYNYNFGAGESKINDDFIILNKLALSF
jgi:hypothetical protein